MATIRLDQFRQAVEPALPALYRAAFRLAGNRADAEDLVQDTCLIAWEKPPVTDADRPLEHWLLRVLYHRFVDGARRRRHGPVRPLNGATDPTPSLVSAAPGPAELADQDEDERAQDLAWPQLEPVKQVLLALRAEGFGLAEIAEITGIGRDVLRARLHRARRSLARLLENPEQTPAAMSTQRRQP
jgi:RNA polymerase sigma-70 factor (ECF subfamily)